jgi:MFS family permease
MCVPFIYVSLAARLVHGLGDGAVTIVVYVGMAKLFHLDRIGGNSGLVFLVFSMSSVVGSLIYGPLGQEYGYAVPLIVSGIMTFLLTPIVYLLPKSV